MLEVAGLVAGYGRITILRDVELRVEPGELVALVGVNGAGKTTLMKAIAGLVPSTGGRVSFDGTALTGQGTERTVEAGVVLVPEGRMVFPRMTVWENLMLGGIHPRSRPHREASLRRVFDLFPRLAERRQQKAATMSGGEQQMLAIGPRPDGRTQAAAARRAVARPFAASGAGNLCRLAQAQCRRNSRSCSPSRT